VKNYLCPNSEREGRSSRIRIRLSLNLSSLLLSWSQLHIQQQQEDDSQYADHGLTIAPTASLLGIGSFLNE